MPLASRTHVETTESVINHDSWNYSPPKLPRASEISLGDIGNVLPFDRVRNPSGRSSMSRKVFLTYRTPANDWKPKVGIAESAAEALLEAARSLKSFLYMKDLFPRVAVTQPRAFAACHRLVARGALRANLDNVLWENSRLGLVA